MKQSIRKWLGITDQVTPQPVVAVTPPQPVIKYQLFGSIKYEPKYATDGSAGIDLIARTNAIIPANGKVWVDSGIGLEIPEGYCGLILGRSGFAYKEDITAYHIGLIDSDYRGQIRIALSNHKDIDHKISIGDKIAQILIIPHLQAQFLQVNELNHTERGAKGFGSTGTTI
jgi:dUTP pyrophosphatase